jgi:hypothetical protein
MHKIADCQDFNDSDLMMDLMEKLGISSEKARNILSDGLEGTGIGLSSEK